jgi:hypothetical protein
MIPTPLPGGGHTPAATCPSCGSDRFARFCAECGERRSEAADLSLRRFLAEAVEALTTADSRLWRSFRALLFQPGRLAAEHLEGRRRFWLGPVQLFVVCNILFFVFLFFLPVHVFTTRLYDQLYSHEYSSRIIGLTTSEGIALWRLVEDPDLYRRYAPAFNAATEGLAKTLVIVMVPAFAGILTLLFHRRRRHFVEHLVFGFHFYAVLMIGIMATVLVGWSLYHGLHAVDVHAHWVRTDAFFVPAVAFLLVLWLVPALRRFYGVGRLTALGAAAVLVFALMYVTLAYRLLLLLLTLQTV